MSHKLTLVLVCGALAGCISQQEIARREAQAAAQADATEAGANGVLAEPITE